MRCGLSLTPLWDGGVVEDFSRHPGGGPGACKAHVAWHPLTVSLGQLHWLFFFSVALAPPTTGPLHMLFTLLEP